MKKLALSFMAVVALTLTGCSTTSDSDAPSPTQPSPGASPEVSPDPESTPTPNDTEDTEDTEDTGTPNDLSHLVGPTVDDIPKDAPDILPVEPNEPKVKQQDSKPEIGEFEPVEGVTLSVAKQKAVYNALEEFISKMSDEDIVRLGEYNMENDARVKDLYKEFPALKVSMVNHGVTAKELQQMFDEGN